jgi:hypothetical protein
MGAGDISRLPCVQTGYGVRSVLHSGVPRAFPERQGGRGWLPGTIFVLSSTAVSVFTYCK